MTREDKHSLVEGLLEELRARPNFYLVDIAGFTVAKTNKLRRACFKEQLKLKTVKNTLLRKSLEQLGDFEEMYPVLKNATSIIFAHENMNAPAKLIKSFRENDERPILKAAFVQDTIFVGNDSLESLINLKSKPELIGDVIGLLQSPMKNVVSGLKGSSSQKIAGLLKTLSERAA